MTYFLAAGFLKEDLSELRAGLEKLRRLLQLSDTEKDKLLTEYVHKGVLTTYKQLLQDTVDELVETVTRTHQVLSQIPSEPLIYTGPESTEEIIARLNRLLIREEQQEAYVADSVRLAGS